MSEKKITLHAMPVAGKRIAPYALFQLIRSLNEGQAVTAYLEKPQSMPGNRAQAMLTYGQGFGAVEGILCALQMRYIEVHPRTWTKEMHQGVDKKLKSKDKSLVAAARLFPGVNFVQEGCKKPHDGFIDAALIALYGWRKENGQHTH
jgi:hypothetical protein